MTETKIADLVGLSEIAEMYGVDVNTVNGWRRGKNWPEPVKRLRMGPMWDKREILIARPLLERFRVSDSTGRLTFEVQATRCQSCNQLQRPINGSLRQGWNQRAGVYLEYSYSCHICFTEGDIVTWPIPFKEEL